MTSDCNDSSWLEETKACSKCGKVQKVKDFPLMQPARLWNGARMLTCRECHDRELREHIDNWKIKPDWKDQDGGYYLQG